MRKKLRVKVKAMKRWMAWKMVNLPLRTLPSTAKSKQARISLPTIPRMSWCIDVLIA